MEQLPTRHKRGTRLVDRNHEIAAKCRSIIIYAEEMGHTDPLTADEWLDLTDRPDGWTSPGLHVAVTSRPNWTDTRLALWYRRGETFGEIILDDDAARWLVYETGILFHANPEPCLF